MRDTHSRKSKPTKAKGDAQFWPKRMRDVAAGKPLDPRTTQRFSREFEQALNQRGTAAKAASEVQHV